VLTFRDFITGFRRLDIDASRPVIAHASLKAFGEVHGGAGTVLGALISSFSTVLMPAFTYKTMLTPEVGPPDNAISYGSGKDANRMAEIFDPGMPVDNAMGVLAESLRKHASALRSTHPILSFSGINAGQILASQSLIEPLLPIQRLVEAEGWVLLLGVGHSANSSIHYGERLAGRKQFIRWALTSQGVVACPGFPGCSDGFGAIASHLDDAVRKVNLGRGVIQAVPLVDLVDTVCAMLKEDPTALLCDREDCQRCNAVRASATNL